MPASRPVLASTALAVLIGCAFGPAHAAAAADPIAVQPGAADSVNPLVMATLQRSSGLLAYSCVVVVTGTATVVDADCDVYVNGGVAASSPVSVGGPVPTEAGVVLVPAGADVSVCSSATATYADGRMQTVTACAHPLQTA